MLLFYTPRKHQKTFSSIITSELCFAEHRSDVIILRTNQKQPPGAFCKKSRSSQQRCSMKKGVLRNFPKFTENHLSLSLFFTKVVGLRSATLLKKRLWDRCFPVNLAKFLIIPFLQNTSGRLLLEKVFQVISQDSQENICATVSLLKKRPWNSYFSVKFLKFLRTPLLQNNSGGCFLRTGRGMARVKIKFSIGIFNSICFEK